MSNSTLFIIIVLVVVFGITVFSYLHKRHREYKMGDIEAAVRSAYTDGKTSTDKKTLAKAIKRYFHCSSKEAHYIIGVARRKKIIDIHADAVTLMA